VGRFTYSPETPSVLTRVLSRPLVS